MRPPKCRRGSFEHADTYGRYNHPNAPVTLRQSSVCDGWGLFATRDIGANQVVTFYEGTFVRGCPLTRAEGDYAFNMPAENAPGGGPGWSLVGVSDVSKLSGKGLAQMANDAIHSELTGVENNCRFVFEGMRIYLRTLLCIGAGTELLASYGLGYWLGRADRPTLPGPMQHWLECHLRVQDLLGDGWWIEEYEGVEQVSENVGHAWYHITNEDPNATMAPCACEANTYVDGASCRRVMVRVSLQDTTRISLVCPVCFAECLLGEAGVKEP